jgi:hypothetical protein
MAADDHRTLAVEEFILNQTDKGEEDPMKKVRLAITAMAPALGVMASPVAAHAATTATDAHAASLTSGKRVSTYSRQGGVGVSPDVVCHWVDATSKSSADHNLWALIGYTGSCVGYQQARLVGKQTGLAERLRAYSKGGAKVTSEFLPGKISGDATFWSSSPNHYYKEVCIAIVYNTNHNDVKNGPVCMDAA